MSIDKIAEWAIRDEGFPPVATEKELQAQARLNELAKKIRDADVEGGREMRSRLEGLYVTLGLGDYPSDWWAAMQKMADAVKAQAHFARLASERYDKILELERRIANAPTI